VPDLATYVKLIAAVTAWGGTFIAAKYAVLYTTVEVAALLRFVTASCALLIILHVKRGHLPRLNAKQLYYVFLLGLTGIAIYNLFFFYGLQTVEAGRGALIITSNPLWVALGSAFFFAQRFRPINIAGLLLCAFGVCIVLSRGHLSQLLVHGVGLGELALLGCALSWATYTLLGKKLMESKSALDPLTLVTYSCVSGSVVLFLWITLNGQPIRVHPSLELLGSIAYLSLLGTVAGFYWYFQAVKKLGASQGAVFVFFVPVSAIILGHLLLDEKITLSLLLGATLIVAGVALVNRPLRA
jgi:drug/metabolite transporter (DMT)-like permease